MKGLGAGRLALGLGMLAAPTALGQPWVGDSATDAGGKCTKKPEICPHLVAPVCGCDQQTHNNACEAARAGVSVASKGACKPE